MNFACGTARLPLSRFSPASAIAALAWAIYTAGLGFVSGAAFVEDPLLGLAVGLGLSFALGGIVYLIRRRATRKVRPEGPADPGRADTAGGTAGPVVLSTAPRPCGTLGVLLELRGRPLVAQVHTPEGRPPVGPSHCGRLAAM
jgi:hypothetical protein